MVGDAALALTHVPPASKGDACSLPGAPVYRQVEAGGHS